jgi:hypothetical protein
MRPLNPRPQMLALIGAIRNRSGLLRRGTP